MDSNPLKELLKDFDVKVYDSGFALHLTNPEIDKGIGLAELAELLGYNIENIMCIGDSENDIDFLRAGGFKVAVANACDELKEIADYVCENKYGDGVAEAIDKFVFNQDQLNYYCLIIFV
jgi:phosphoglycolate phosphatase (TIGR01487 family)